MPKDKSRTARGGNEKDVFDLPKILETHVYECQQNGDYETAKLAREKLGQLRLKHVDWKRAELGKKHEAETQETLENQEHEFQQFFLRWQEEEVPDLEESIRRLEEELRERQQVELYEFKTKLSAEMYKPKFSPKVLDLERRLALIGHAEMYSEASKLQKKIAAMKKVELERAHEEQQRLLEGREQRFLQKQANEAASLTSKTAKLRMEKAEQQKREYKALSKRHQSQAALLEAQHRAERSVYAKEVQATVRMNAKFAAGMELD
jgi:hypothetical protein